MDILIAMMVVFVFLIVPTIMIRWRRQIDEDNKKLTKRVNDLHNLLDEILSDSEEGPMQNPAAYPWERHLDEDEIEEDSVQDIRKIIRDRNDEAIQELTEAIRLTVEYVGLATLPAAQGWSWYDALRKYAPEVARHFHDEYRTSLRRENSEYLRAYSEADVKATTYMYDRLTENPSSLSPKELFILALREVRDAVNEKFERELFGFDEEVDNSAYPEETYTMVDIQGLREAYKPEGYHFDRAPHYYPPESSESVCGLHGSILCVIHRDTQHQHCRTDPWCTG